MYNPFTKASPRQGVDLLIVPVDEYSYDHEVSEDEGINFLSMFLPAKGFENDPANAKRLPPGSYTFLFASLSVDDEDKVMEVVEHWDSPTGGGDVQDYYKNYSLETDEDYMYQYHYTDPFQSLQSLLRSVGLDPARNYALIKIETP